MTGPKGSVIFCLAMNKGFLNFSIFLRAMVFLLPGLLFFSCNKSIEEPKHKNSGRNFVYLKIDDSEHLIHDALHLNKAAKGKIWGYDEGDYKPRVFTSEINGRESFKLDMGFRSKEYEPVSLSWVSLDLIRSGDGFVLERLMLNIIAFSAKHGRKVDVYSTQVIPREIQIEKLDEEKQQIAFTFSMDYQDIGDKSISGTLYFYMDCDYATSQKE